MFVQMRLQEENERCLIYLDASTRKPLVATAERQLLERHINAILDKVAVVESIAILYVAIAFFPCACMNGLVTLTYSCRVSRHLWMGSVLKTFRGCICSSRGSMPLNH